MKTIKTVKIILEQPFGGTYNPTIKGCTDVKEIDGTLKLQRQTDDNNCLSLGSFRLDKIVGWYISDEIGIPNNESKGE